MIAEVTVSDRCRRAKKLQMVDAIRSEPRKTIRGRCGLARLIPAPPVLAINQVRLLTLCYIYANHNEYFETAQLTELPDFDTLAVTSSGSIDTFNLSINDPVLA